MIYRSMRGRVALSAAVATAAVMLVAGWLVLRVVAGEEHRLLDSRLAEQATAVEGPLARALITGAPLDSTEFAFRRPDVGTIVRLYSGSTLVAAVGSPALEFPGPSGSGFDTVSVAGLKWRTLTTDFLGQGGNDPQAFHLLTAVPLTATNELVDSLRNRVLLVSVVSTLLAGMLGWLFGEVAVRPLARLRSDAEQVAGSQDLSLRIAPPSGPQEIEDLASTLNLMLERLEQSAASTSSALASSRAFAGNAAHEMRTPLTSMQANLDVLGANPDLPVESRQEITDAVRREQNRLVALLDALHTLARGDVVGEFQREPVDLADIVGVAVESAQRRYPDVTFSYEVPGEEATLDGWPEGLRVLVDNLLNNAARHGGSRVDVVVRAEPDRLCLRVDDDGPGIPEEERESVFEYFFRGRNAVVPGSGLGLALVKQQATLHGGGVRIERSPLGGACVLVDLACREPAS